MNEFLREMEALFLVWALIGLILWTLAPLWAA